MNKPNRSDLLATNDVATSRPADATVDVSVSIVTFNSAHFVKGLIESINASRGNLSVEFLITDNASEDARALESLVASEFPGVQATYNVENRFFTRADNQNIGKARGRYVLSINPDTRCIGNAIQSMVEFLEGHPDVGAVTPRILKSDATLRPSLGLFPSRAWGLLHASGLNAIFRENSVNRRIMTRDVTYDPEAVVDAEVLYGACIMVRRQVIEQIGLKDEALIHGWDEYDWSRRMQQAGWRTCYYPGAAIMHVENASRQTLTRVGQSHLAKLEEEGLLHLFKSHVGIPTWLLMWVLMHSVKPVLLLGIKAFLLGRNANRRAIKAFSRGSS